MKIDYMTREEFRIGDIFSVKIAKSNDIGSLEAGEIPFVGRGTDNNGFQGSVLNDSDYITAGGCITVGMVGSFRAFYQKRDFCASQNILLLRNDCMTELSGMFVCTLINRLTKDKFSYNRPIQKRKFADELLLLPSSDGCPDWEYMENYIKSLRSKPISTSIQLEKIKIKVCEYKEFVFGEIIDKIYKSKSYVKAEIDVLDKPTNTSIPFVSRTEMNNSVDGFVDAWKPLKYEEGNAIVIGDTTAVVSYQRGKFVTGDHIVVIRASWLNVYTGLFITTLLNKERFRYSYGRAFLKNAIVNTRLMLPIDHKGNPDWEYMENYIKSLPYSDRI